MFPVTISPDTTTDPKRGPKKVLRLSFDYPSFKQQRAYPGIMDGWTELKDTVKKSMRGSRWDKAGSQWVVDSCYANYFIFTYLDVNQPNPYDLYRVEAPGIDLPTERMRCGYIKKVMRHQLEDAAEIVFKRQGILAAEMGTGKTLTVLQAMEHIAQEFSQLGQPLRSDESWYVAPRFAVGEMAKEFRNWNAKYTPSFYSYNEAVKAVQTWPKGRIAPKVLILDESAQCKGPNSQRSLYMQALAEGMRVDHEDPVILLMCGAPAPKSPKDWWMQMEIAAPGYLAEGNPFSFERRLALFTEEQSFAGGSYPKLVTWLDDENKCAICGQYEDHPNHPPKEMSKDEVSNFTAMLAQGNMSALLSGLQPATPPGSSLADKITQPGGLSAFNQPVMQTMPPHKWKKSKDEVSFLYKRMRGPVWIRFKKDVTDLPDKHYRIIDCKPDASTIRAARLIVKSAATTIEALTKLRTLSDGFQYEWVDHENKTEACERCSGTGRDFIPDSTEFRAIGESVGERGPCPNCNGTGQVPQEIRITNKVACPKDAVLAELLEENEENGRLVVYAGFTAAIERVIEVCQKNNWQVIRADGKTRTLPRGMWTSTPMDDPIDVFQDPARRIPRIVFVANQGTAKTAITLTASSMLVYYSNTFIGDDRIQSEDRIHRLGMDLNKGATIVDICHLPSDYYVLDNIQKKRVLQGITLGQFRNDMAAALVA